MGLFSYFRNAIRKHRETMRSVTQNEIIAIALENGGKITSAALATRTPLSVYQASMKLQSMYGVFRTKYDYKHQSNVFVLKKPEMYANLDLRAPMQTTSSQKKKGISDAEVIQTALRTKGRITAGVLCVKADISIDEAKKRLQELQHKGVFDIEATASGALVYVLNELESFGDLIEDQLEHE